MAAAVADVMAQVGYDRYVAQGGDWGALVTRYLGEHFTPNVVAIHTNMLFALPPEGAPDAMEGVTEDEIAAGIRHAYFAERQIVEGSGAVGIGALLAGKVTLGGPAMVVLSGGNIDMGVHHRVVSGETVDVSAEAA